MAVGAETESQRSCGTRGLLSLPCWCIIPHTCAQFWFGDVVCVCGLSSLSEQRNAQFLIKFADLWTRDGLSPPGTPGTDQVQFSEFASYRVLNPNYLNTYRTASRARATLAKGHSWTGDWITQVHDEAVVFNPNLAVVVPNRTSNSDKHVTRI